MASFVDGLAAVRKRKRTSRSRRTKRNGSNLSACAEEYFYHTGGAILWTCTGGLGTYGMRRDSHAIAALFHQYALFLDALSVAAVLGVLAYVLRSRKRE